MPARWPAASLGQQYNQDGVPPPWAPPRPTGAGRRGRRAGQASARQRTDSPPGRAGRGPPRPGRSPIRDESCSALPGEPTGRTPLELTMIETDEVERTGEAPTNLRLRRPAFVRFEKGIHHERRSGMEDSSDGGSVTRLLGGFEAVVAAEIEGEIEWAGQVLQSADVAPQETDRSSGVAGLAPRQANGAPREVNGGGGPGGVGVGG